MIEWEIISDGHCNATKRLRVPRGWLVLYKDWAGDNEISTTMIFVEDLHHQWEVTND